MIKHYKTTACNTCPVRNLCTRNPDGRLIERSQHAQKIEQNKINAEANPQIYKRRQAIVEHPYNIIKQQWGFYYSNFRSIVFGEYFNLPLIFINGNGC